MTCATHTDLDFLLASSPLPIRSHVGIHYFVLHSRLSTRCQCSLHLCNSSRHSFIPPLFFLSLSLFSFLTFFLYVFYLTSFCFFFLFPSKNKGCTIETSVSFCKHITAYFPHLVYRTATHHKAIKSALLLRHFIYETLLTMCLPRT